MTSPKSLGRVSMTWGAVASAGSAWAVMVWAAVASVGVVWAVLAWGGVEGFAEKFQRLPDVGRCGSSVLTKPISSRLVCAAVCAQDPLCEGFSSSSSSCEKVRNVSMPDLNPVYTCFVTASVYNKLATTSTAAPTNMTTTSTNATTTSTNATTTSTNATTTSTNATTTSTNATTTSTNATTTSTNMTTTSTTEPPTTTEGPIMVTSWLGVSGVKVIGFTYTNDSFIGFLSFAVFDNPVSNPPSTTKSTALSNSEECGANQVMVGLGDLGTTDYDKSDQRMYCADVVSPHNVTPTCQVVSIGQLPRPTVSGTNTSSWYNWFACQSSYVITKWTWIYDKMAPYTPYRYSTATCCLVV
ncbi:uncharacterized protein [Procambarus clarkii]|uniref:uncharacterized protein n=1 Tax=Procambarus clarkii TaxID=6728 RepID=UPI0037447D0D